MFGVSLLGWLLGCGSVAPAPRPPAVVAESLRIGTSGDYSPFSTLDPQTLQREGFDVEVAKRLAHDLGLKIEWVAFRWPELQTAVTEGRFDIAMSGVTWRSTRAVVGWMTHSVASGGPCLLGDPTADKLAVNRGGALETWARQTHPDRTILAVEDNQKLPELLASATVGAVVTDSFELASFQRAEAQSPTWKSQCQPPTWKKVYWLTPERVSDLAPRVEAWIGENEQLLRELRAHWFGDEQLLDPSGRLVELLGRRLALMPHVAAYKRDNALPIEDLQREARVLKRVNATADKYRLNRESLRKLFQLQMDLAKSVQRRASPAASIDLNAGLRPALSRLGPRIVEELAQLVRERKLATLDAEQLLPLSAWLEPAELQQLAQALRGPWQP